MKVYKNKYIRYFSVILSGGILSQIVYFLTLPVISRLYSVNDFAELSIFTSILIVLSTIAAFRYDTAISLSENKTDTLNLFFLSFIISTLFSLILLIIVVILYQLDLIKGYLLLLPLSVWLCSTSNAIINFYLKYKRYKKVSLLKLSQTTIMSTTQIFLGLYMPFLGSSGLALGQAANYTATSVFQMNKIVNFNRIKKIKIKELKSTALKYSKYFKYSTFDSIFNLFGLHFPIIFLTIAYDSYIMGILYMALRIIQTPISVVISSASQIYYSNIQEKENKEVLFHFTIKMVSLLAGIGIAGFTIYYLIENVLIEILLGEAWQSITDISLWLLPWFFLQLLSSPISTVMYKLNRHKEMMYITLFGLIFRLLPLIIFFNMKSTVLVEIFCLSNALYYLVCLLIFLYFARPRNNSL